MHQCLWYGSAHMGYHIIEFENAYCSLTSSYKLLITLWWKERYCDIFTFQFNFFYSSIPGAKTYIERRGYLP